MSALPIVLTLVTQLARSGVVGADEIEAMAAALEQEGETEAALQVRGAFIEAQAPASSDWRADRARQQIRIVSDGGNEAT